MPPSLGFGHTFVGLRHPAKDFLIYLLQSKIQWECPLADLPFFMSIIMLVAAAVAVRWWPAGLGRRGQPAVSLHARPRRAHGGCARRARRRGQCPERGGHAGVNTGPYQSTPPPTTASEIASTSCWYSGFNVNSRRLSFLWRRLCGEHSRLHGWNPGSGDVGPGADRALDGGVGRRGSR